ncbi:MAG TPA: DUF1579 domain-containing protein [Phycisphaerales bacterium]|nr:DUF1579 domain-containing protein [Phycisphaerales bacterium]
MKRSHLLLSACCLTVIAAGVAIGQPGKDKAPAMPEMTPEQMKCMEAMQEAATPGPMHEWLAKGIGTWDGTIKMWESPDSAEAHESPCSSVVTSMMDGRFIKDEVSSTMMGMPFQGFGIYGYNNTTQQFEANWIDNMGTMQMRMTGKLAADHKSMTWTSRFMCPVQKKEVGMREVQTWTGPDSIRLEMYGPDMSGKVAEYKMMEINMTRKAGSAPKAAMPIKKMGH